VCTITRGLRAAGCEIVAENLWPKAPADAIIFGLKELPEDGTPLTHRHIMFGHAYKGQPAGRVLLDRFIADYAGVNSYTRVELEDASTGVLFKWPPRLGQQPLL
jgi:hypothetical protein